jgi:hypothetical protein
VTIVVAASGTSMILRDGVRGIEVVDDQDTGEDAEDAGRRSDLRRGDRSSGIAAAGARFHVGDRDVEPSEVGVARSARAIPASMSSTSSALRERTERGGDRRFVSRAHLDRVADRAADAGAAAIISAAALRTSSARPSAAVCAVSDSRSRSAACSRSRIAPTSFSAAVASRCARS